MQDVSAAKTCPYFKFSLKEPVVHCSVCGLEHHEGCWKANFGCTKECTKAKAIQGPRPEVPPTADAPAATAPEPAQPLPPAPAPHTPAALPARFQVVLGDAGKTPEQQDAVARQMAQDFGIELDKVRIVLARLPAVARRNLDEAEARTLAERFRTMGADASVQVMA
jgi:pyruvate/2-oxoglutarate dehydrogenase complex dihydrolipoamide acyltransferase (E2) component